MSPIHPYKSTTSKSLRRPFHWGCVQGSYACTSIASYQPYQVLELCHTYAKWKSSARLQPADAHLLLKLINSLLGCLNVVFSCDLLQLIDLGLDLSLDLCRHLVSKLLQLLLCLVDQTVSLHSERHD